MKPIKLPNKVTRAFYKTGFQLKKHSPEILAAAGVVGVVASTIMACRATTKLGDILNESRETIDGIHEGMENGQILGHEYTKNDGKKDLTIVYTKTGIKIARLYAPAVMVGTTAIFAMLKSNNILRKRNVALAAAYATVDSSFKQYRGRVIERFGQELDRELKYNIKAQEIEETVTDEKGNEKVVKKTVKAMNPNDISEYAKFFDEYCPDWSDNPEDNLRFLRMQQSYANDKLRLQTYLFLNDVYEMLGLPKTAAGQAVGWTYDEKHPRGDNFVDFGLYDDKREGARLFVNGHEKSILLEFNVDGDILSNFRRI